MPPKTSGMPIRTVKIFRISLCTCKKVAENGAFGNCFRHPFHQTPTRASGRFDLILVSNAPKRPESLHRRTVAHVFDIQSYSPSPPPPFLRGTCFGSKSSVPKMDFSRSTLRIMARGIHRAVLPTGLRPHLPFHHRH